MLSAALSFLQQRLQDSVIDVARSPLLSPLRSSLKDIFNLLQGRKKIRSMIHLSTTWIVGTLTLVFLITKKPIPLDGIYNSEPLTLSIIFLGTATGAAFISKQIMRLATYLYTRHGTGADYIDIESITNTAYLIKKSDVKTLFEDFSIKIDTLKNPKQLEVIFSDLLHEINNPMHASLRQLAKEALQELYKGDFTGYVAYAEQRTIIIQRKLTALKKIRALITDKTTATESQGKLYNFLDKLTATGSAKDIRLRGQKKLPQNQKQIGEQIKTLEDGLAAIERRVHHHKNLQEGISAHTPHMLLDRTANTESNTDAVAIDIDTESRPGNPAILAHFERAHAAKAQANTKKPGAEAAKSQAPRAKSAPPPQGGRHKRGHHHHV